MDKISYALGMSIAQSLLQSGVTELNVEDFGAAVKAGLSGQMPALDFEEAGKILDDFFKDIQSKQAAKAADIFSDVCPNAEVNLLSGGQPVYYYLISAE